jgi:NADPH:quinone reductase-like Zn-dependent oxidoreductase
MVPNDPCDLAPSDRPGRWAGSVCHHAVVRAIVQDEYGSPDVLRLEEIDVPVAGDGELLVRVRASSVHPDVWHAVRGIPFVLRLMGSGVRRPMHRVPGTDVAGTVESVGPGVTRFQPGDEVFGEMLRANLWRNGGAYAEFVAVAQDLLEPKPARLSWAQAAAAPNASKIAVQGLRDEGRIRAGQRVLIVGAGGGVGSAAVQVAKAFDAHVTGVDAGDKLDLVRSIGADEVIDHTREDPTRAAQPYDLILDIAGNRPYAEMRHALTPDGTYVMIGHDDYGRLGRRWIGSMGRFVRLLVRSRFDRRLPGLRAAKDPGDRLRVAAELIDAGSLTPVVDRTFPLHEAPAAIRYLERGGARGRVVITVDA